MHVQVFPIPIHKTVLCRLFPHFLTFTTILNRIFCSFCCCYSDSAKKEKAWVESVLNVKIGCPTAAFQGTNGSRVMDIRDAKTAWVGTTTPATLIIASLLMPLPHSPVTNASETLTLRINSTCTHRRIVHETFRVPSAMKLAFVPGPMRCSTLRVVIVLVVLGPTMRDVKFTNFRINKLACNATLQPTFPCSRMDTEEASPISPTTVPTATRPFVNSVSCCSIRTTSTQTICCSKVCIQSFIFDQPYWNGVTIYPTEYIKMNQNESTQIQMNKS